MIKNISASDIVVVNLKKMSFINKRSRTSTRDSKQIHETARKIDITLIKMNIRLPRKNVLHNIVYTNIA